MQIHSKNSHYHSWENILKYLQSLMYTMFLHQGEKKKKKHKTFFFFKYRNVEIFSKHSSSLEHESTQLWLRSNFSSPGKRFRFQPTILTINSSAAVIYIWADIRDVQVPCTRPLQFAYNRIKQFSRVFSPWRKYFQLDSQWKSKYPQWKLYRAEQWKDYGTHCLVSSISFSSFLKKTTSSRVYCICFMRHQQTSMEDNCCSTRGDSKTGSNTLPAQAAQGQTSRRTRDELRCARGSFYSVFSGRHNSCNVQLQFLIYHLHMLMDKSQLWVRTPKMYQSSPSPTIAYLV